MYRSVSMLAFLLLAVPANGGITLPDNLVDALEQNVSVLSTSSIAGTRQRSFIGHADSVLKKLGTLKKASEFTQLVNYSIHVDVANFRESIEYPSGETNTSNKVLETSFDGDTFRTGYRNLRFPTRSHVYIRTPQHATEQAKQANAKRMFIDKVKFWYLEETGYAVPQSIDELGDPLTHIVLWAYANKAIVSIEEIGEQGGSHIDVTYELPEPWQSDETFDIASHKEYQEFSGKSRELQMRLEAQRRKLLGATRQVRVRLDPSRGFAVEQRWVTRKEDGELLFHTVNDEFYQIAEQGVWLPRRCSTASHAYRTAPTSVSPGPLYTSVLTLKSFVNGGSDGDSLSIWYDIPGSKVTDWRTTRDGSGEPDTYRVTAPIEDSAIGGNRLKIVLISLNVACILILSAVLLRRKFRSRA